jgi:hypothetical protein
MKIISGGQTGVDQAVLKAGLLLGYQIGGWCPPGRTCEDGKIPSDYPLLETPNDRSAKAPDIPGSQRTENNVRDADATLVLQPSRLETDKGTAWTIACAQAYKKHYLVVDPYDPDAIRQVKKWLQLLKVEIINIAGPRESIVPGINQQACNLLLKVFSTNKELEITN